MHDAELADDRNPVFHFAPMFHFARTYYTGAIKENNETGKTICLFSFNT